MKIRIRHLTLGCALIYALCTTQTASAWYIPSAQRWVNRDPIEEFGGINLFSFVANRPTVLVDGDGQAWWPPSKWPWPGKRKPKPPPQIKKLPPWLTSEYCSAWLADPDEISCYECCTEQFVLREGLNVGQGCNNLERYHKCKSDCLLSGGLRGPTVSPGKFF